MGAMLTPPLKFICALTAALALAVGLTGNAYAAKGMEMAVQDDAVLWQGLYSNPQVDLVLAEGLHATRLKANILWYYVVGSKTARKKKAPRHIKYNWSGYDALIANANAQGMKVQLALTGPAPAYATSNHRIGPMKPSATKFRAFASAAAKHFKGRVDRYSIWNEPNHRGWIAPIKSQAKIYRALYLKGYSAIKRADRHAKVLFGETSPFGLAHGRNAQPPLKFIRAVTCADKRYKRAKHTHCGRIKTDGVAHHPYDFDHKPT